MLTNAGGVPSFPRAGGVPSFPRCHDERLRAFYIDLSDADAEQMGKEHIPLVCDLTDCPFRDGCVYAQKREISD